MEILIGRESKVTYSDKIKGAFEPACVFDEAGIVFFNRIPKHAYEVVEECMEEILEHEGIHIALCQRIDERTSFMWDNIFPTVEKFKDWVESE